jgi:hypothetical protein
MHDPAKSAKPPSPVQIRAAPPKFRNSIVCAAEHQMDAPQTRRAAGRLPPFVEADDRLRLLLAAAPLGYHPPEHPRDDVARLLEPIPLGLRRPPRSSVAAKRSTALQSAAAGLRLISTSGTRPSLGCNGLGPPRLPCPAPRARGRPSPGRDGCCPVGAILDTARARRAPSRSSGSGPSSSASPRWGND